MGAGSTFQIIFPIFLAGNLGKVGLVIIPLQHFPHGKVVIFCKFTLLLMTLIFCFRFAFQNVGMEVLSGVVGLGSLQML